MTQIPLAAGAEASVLFRCEFDRAGSHVVEVTADADDLAADNQYAAAVSVLDRVGVLVVNGDASAQPLRGETDFLQIALQPFSAAGDTLADLIQARLVEPSQFDRAALDGVRVVILANVVQLTDLQVAALDRFVRGGGGLLVFPGNRLNLDWYDRVFASGPAAILPLRYASLAGPQGDSASQAAIVAEHYVHPALNQFNDRRNGNLSDGRVSVWFRLVPPETEDRARNAAVQELLQLSVGDPLMVECQRGAGRVVQVATACDADWSNLPLRPFYLPLVQQLVLHLASTWDPPRNVELGQAIVATVETMAEAPLTFTCTDPAGRSHAVASELREGRAMVRYEGEELPGIYQLTSNTVGPLHFVVSAPRSESQLTTLSDAQTRELADQLGGAVIRSADEYVHLDALRRHGRPVWKPLLWCVVALLLAELFVARRVSRDTS